MLASSPPVERAIIKNAIDRLLLESASGARDCDWLHAVRSLVGLVTADEFREHYLEPLHHSLFTARCLDVLRVASSFKIDSDDDLFEY